MVWNVNSGTLGPSITLALEGVTCTVKKILAQLDAGLNPHGNPYALLHWGLLRV